MEGVERRRNADFPLPFFSYESICSRRTHGIRCFPEKVAVTKRYLCFFSKRRSLTEDICIFFQKKAIPRRYLYFFPQMKVSHG